MANKEVQVTPASDFDSAKLYLWVKGLETKVNNLLRQMDVMKNDFIKRNNEMRKEVRTINEDLVDLKHKREKMNQKIDLIIKELKKTAGMEEVLTIKKYLDLWNPMNFVTQRDLERAIESKIFMIKEAANKQENKKGDEL